MSERIARHQRRREEYGPAWQTIEEPRQLAPVLRQTQGCRLIECVPLWLTGLLCDPPVLDDDAVAAAMQEFVTVVGTTTSGPVIVVSAEAGLGMLPPNELARRFADALGSANQQLAAVATDVWLVVAGLPVRLKGGGGEAS
jgi:adenosylcobinamide kinase/adenosylcobinamide-phosphate guanylyltransferase